MPTHRHALALSAFALMTWGCNPADTQADVAHSPQANTILAGDLDAIDRHYYGAPEGASPFPAMAVLSEEDLGDPDVQRAQQALPAAAHSLRALAEDAPSWADADAALAAYLADPPDEAAAVPPYVLEQTATLAFLAGSPFLDAPDTPAKRAAAQRHLDVLLDNRSPDLSRIADLVAVAGADWPRGQRRAVVARALAANAQYLADERTKARELAGCDGGCREVVFGDTAGRRAEWREARDRLEASER